MHPDDPSQSRAAGPGKVSALCRWSAEGLDTKRADTPTERWPCRRPPRPTRAPFARGDQHKRHLLFRALGPGLLRALSKASPPALASSPGAGYKGGTGSPTLAPSPGGPGCPEGLRTRGSQRAAPRPGGAPEARRVLDALLELHRHGCGGARRSLARGPRRPERHPRPACPSARPRRDRRPPAPERGRCATAPPRLSPPGSVAKVLRPRAPPAVTAGERRQTLRRPAPLVPAAGRKSGWAQQQSQEPLGRERSSGSALGNLGDWQYELTRSAAGGLGAC